MASYNTTRFVEDLLEKTVNSPPSFTVHLHLEHWTLNNGSKFLYNNQIASLLDDVRAHRIPVDFLDLFEAAKVPFYDGCMIVELLDYRPQRGKETTLDKPERTRAVLHPNSETLWADICAMNKRFGGKWTDRDALEMEARLVLATSPPLCLDPNPHLARVANHVMRVSTPTVPVSLKRKAVTSDPEEDESDKARRAKIMAFMNSRQNRSAPNYRILDAIQRRREKGANPDQVQTPASTQNAPSPTKSATPAITISQTQSPAPSEKGKVAPSALTVIPTYSRANGSVTPVPQPPTHQFINQTPTNPPTPVAHSPMLPQTYPSVQAATEAAKRTPTPAQIKQYAASPRPPSRAPAPVSVPVSMPVQQPQQNIKQTARANAFKPVQAAHYMAQAPRGIATKGIPPNNGANLPQQQNPPQTFANQQQMMAYRQQQQQAQALQMAAQAASAQKVARENGHTTPAQLGVPNAPSPAGVARNSPMVPSNSLTARSPMPPTTQLAPAQQHQMAQLLQHQQQQQHSQQHPQQHPVQHTQTFTPSYNPAQLRPGMVSHSSQVPSQLAAAAAAAHSQAQAQALAQAQAQAQRPGSATGAQQQPHGMYLSPQMYGYAPMNYPQGQMTAQQAQLYRQYQMQQQQLVAQQQARMNGQQGVAAKATAAGGGMQGR